MYIFLHPVDGLLECRHSNSAAVLVIRCHGNNVELLLKHHDGYKSVIITIHHHLSNVFEAPLA